MSDSQREIQEIRARLEKLEAQMIYLYRSLGMTTNAAPASNASPKVIELVKRGDTLGAIKAFREETGASLKDAKTYIESLEV